MKRLSFLRPQIVHLKVEFRSCFNGFPKRGIITRPLARLLYLGKKWIDLVVPHGYGPHEASAVIPSSAVTVHTSLWQEVQVGEEKGKEKRKEKGKGKGN